MGLNNSINVGRDTLVSGIIINLQKSTGRTTEEAGVWRNKSIKSVLTYPSGIAAFNRFKEKLAKADQATLTSIWASANGAEKLYSQSFKSV